MNDMNKSVKHLCCVCSGSGEHDIFFRIPVNVHANPNEFRFWRETIAEMIADISGIYVSTSISLLAIDCETSFPLFPSIKSTTIDYQRGKELSAKDMHNLHNIFETCRHVSQTNY